jgi:hypothetical protein
MPCPVACYLVDVVVNRDPETFVGVTSRLGLEDQVVPNDPQRFQISRAACAFPILFEPVLFLGCNMRGRRRDSQSWSWRIQAHPLRLGKSSH